MWTLERVTSRIDKYNYSSVSICHLRYLSKYCRVQYRTIPESNIEQIPLQSVLNSFGGTKFKDRQNEIPNTKWYYGHMNLAFSYQWIGQDLCVGRNLKIVMIRKHATTSCTYALYIPYLHMYTIQTTEINVMLCLQRTTAM